MRKKHMYFPLIAATLLLTQAVTYAQSYCTVSGSASFPAWYVSRVKFNTIDNNTGTGTNSGYCNYTGTSTTVKRGSTYSIKVEHATSTGGSPLQGYPSVKVWIDYNRNGDFDASELAFTQSAPTLTSSCSGSITIPGNAALGKTRMRVKYAKAHTGPCESGYLGQVEDYTVNITKATNAKSLTLESDLFGETNITAYPNPTDGKVSFTDAEQISHIDVYNTMGQKVYSSDTGDQLDLSRFTSGMYSIKVQLKDSSEQMLRIVKK